MDDEQPVGRGELEPENALAALQFHEVPAGTRRSRFLGIAGPVLGLLLAGAVVGLLILGLLLVLGYAASAGGIAYFTRFL